MAVVVNANGVDYRGLSTDNKPTGDWVAVNSIYLELDSWMMTKLCAVVSDLTEHLFLVHILMEL